MKEEEEIQEKENSSNILSFKEDSLKPKKIIIEETFQDNIPKQKIVEENPEIRPIKLQRKEPEEDYLFSPTKLILDEEIENDSEDEQFLFKPAELIYEDPLEIFNKKIEQNETINPLKPLDLKIEQTEKEEKEEKKQPKINDKKEIIKPSKHFITTMKESIEKNTVGDNKNSELKNNGKFETEKKYSRYQHYQKKENEKTSKEKIQKNIEKNKNEKPKENITLYISKYSKVSHKNKTGEKNNNKEREDNNSIYISKYSKVTNKNKKEDKNKEKEKIIQENKENEKNMNINESQYKKEKLQKLDDKNESKKANEKSNGYEYGKRKFQKEESEKEEVKYVNTIETSSANSKYGGR